MLFLVGRGVYQSEFSDAAHLQHQCTTAWKQSANDKAVMDGLFEQHPFDGETVLPQWTTAASDLLGRLNDNPGCFTQTAIKVAADNSYYPPEQIDPGTLEGVIACVQARRSGCGDTEERIVVPVYVSRTAPQTITPAGPTAICMDGTYSYSLHHSGTCSYHGGVSQWLP